MAWLNRSEIDMIATMFDPETPAGRAADLLRRFQEEVDAHSDGWPYWTPPSHAARQLMDLLQAQRLSGMGGYPTVPPLTDAQVNKALTPMKRFMTMRGRAAGMVVAGL